MINFQWQHECEYPGGKIQDTRDKKNAYNDIKIRDDDDDIVLLGNEPLLLLLNYRQFERH